MAKDKTIYKCKECGFESPNWMGRCTNCGTWNSMVEMKGNNKSKNINNSEPINSPTSITQISTGQNSRYFSGISEFDRVLGGGTVKGSLVLLGGAPGIGKSTLILQVASLFSAKYKKVLYVSGEESARQIKLRADRINSTSKEMYILAETDFSQIDQVLSSKNENDYGFVVIDSIQTIYHPEIDTTPGSISQVKGIANRLMKIAKQNEIPVFLIGHMTKSGKIAGPRVLEHLVDTVLRFDGDRNYSYRILRSVKNRFGSTNEIGVFDMDGNGLKEVKNPSQLFLEERPENSAGSIIVPVLEGSRTILVELQALVSSSAYSAPQRLTTGIDNKRVSMLLAVLEKKCGFNFYDSDIHLNITGGLSVDEPGIDLGIVTAVLSSFQDKALSSKLAVVGEVGLAGEIRAVNQIKKRINELEKLGFSEIIIPYGNKKSLDNIDTSNLIFVKDIHELIDILFK